MHKRKQRLLPERIHFCPPPVWISVKDFQVHELPRARETVKDIALSKTIIEQNLLKEKTL
jgi:hypothetical protein